ncbi:MAG: bifunctional diaminohydroxyphosphoribosylaminopyrimidine deaminase/5-amino-6-(5-phosphoribosylamino)uracil reductase RibD [Hyphomicrobiaceae bacterium]|nr:bifunctional diaminohydroxyphosphoribosylaminopyrimidine deaminase/5-amino-6-(5-phosphoribosylamino)uracil reductase RibD [Hyphomicrobiaceae bacterium]
MARTPSSRPESPLGGRDDARFMDIALSLARRGLGTTAPNPAVGAVIVDEATGEVIARGWTQPGGRPHAETEALRRAGPRAHGATIYVTLEPCSHHGGTPPCAEALVAAGLARVVVAIEDPDPRVSGRGLDRLRAAGVAVARGVLSEEADWITRGHILRVSERRPFIQLKLALGPDGSVPRGAGGKPLWVTGPEARAHGHLLRAMTDAILVGRRTVEDDDPELTCRLPGLAARSPSRVVLARNLDLSLDCRLVRTARDHPVVVFCGPAAPAGRRTALEGHGCEVVAVREIDDALWLPAVAEELAARNVTRLLVEGGAAVWHSFARAGFVDEVVLFHARDQGEGDRNRLLSRLRDTLLPGIGLSLTAERAVGGDDMLVFRRRTRTR